MKEDEIVKLLERIEKALRVEEGYFIYVAKSQLTTIENILKDYGINYKIYETMMLDLYEIQLILKNPQIFDEIKTEIINKGIPAHVSRMRLPMTGMITNYMYALKENDYDYLVIDLGTARTDELFEIAGTSFTVKKLTATNPVKVKFNDVTKQAVELEDGDIFDFEFKRFYLSNTAEANAVLAIFIGRRI